MNAAPTLTEQALAAPLEQHTPMMAQYRRIKSELPKDTLLLFRLVFQQEIATIRLHATELIQLSIITISNHATFPQYTGWLLLNRLHKQM